MNQILKLGFFFPDPQIGGDIVSLLNQKGLHFQHLLLELPENLPSAVRSFQPEVILCLGVTGAKAVLESLGALEQEIPVVLLIEPEEEAAAIELLGKGVEDYLFSERLERLPGLLKNAAYSRRWENRRQEEKPGESTPQQSKEQYRLLFQEGPLPKWIYNKKTYRILDVNEAAIRHYGYSREEFIGKSLLDLRPKEQVPEIRRRLEASEIDTRDFWLSQTQHQKKDGTLISVEIFGFNIEFNKFPCALVVCQDITQREAIFEQVKRAEQEALKASEEKEIILESIGDAFYAVDTEWTITYWNKHAATLLNLSREEAVGQHLWELFPDAMDTAFYSGFMKAIEENRVVPFEEYFERTGSWYEVRVYPSASGLSVYFRDITERKKAELQLLELNRELQLYTDELTVANKGLEQFSYMVSHNLRSPVANILGLADILKQKDLPEDMRQRFQEELVNNVGRLDSVILDLNAILETKGGISQQREWIILEELVLSISSGIEDQIKKEQVELLTDFSAVEKVRCLKPYLYSIFQNLIYNSIKYRHPDRSPKIEVWSEKKEAKILLHFRDNGLGLNLVEKGDQLFNMYKRFHNHVDGKGMGLFMVKTQVELLGGKISVQSEVGEGMEFEITFPETLVT